MNHLLANWRWLLLWLGCAVALSLCTAASIMLGESASASSSLPILPSEGPISIRGHVLYRDHREIGVSFTQLQMNYTRNVTVKIHCDGCQPGKPSTRGFVTEHRMRGEQIPNDATLYIEITRRNWIGYFIRIRDAGKEHTKEAVFCLYPRHKRHTCPGRPPVKSTNTTTPTQATPQPPAMTTPLPFHPIVTPNREAITSVNSTTADLAPYSGEFTIADQPFTPRSNVVTYLGVTVGNPNLAPGPSADTLPIQLCLTPTCEGGALASANAEVNNYGLSAAAIGEVAVTPDDTYYIVWTPPSDDHGGHWVTFWHGGGPTIASSKDLEAIARGYNEGAAGSTRAIIDYAGSQPPPAPYAGPFVYAYQNFEAASDTITKLGVVLGNPKLVRNESLEETVVVRLCETPECATGVLATADPHIVNYGVTEVDVGDVPVTQGATYYVNWVAPKRYEAASWETFWFGPGPRLEEATLTEAFAKGYDRDGEAALLTYYTEIEANLGAPTFSNPTTATGGGPPVEPGATVDVTCKLFNPELASLEPEGYWYLIHTYPWSDAYYAAANTFWNGAPPGEVSVNVDARVPNCAS
jgi:hypothetical protein